MELNLSTQDGSTTVRELIIVGSGPAGYAAAIYAARAQLAPLVFEGATAGGALTTTTEVDNYPGFPSGIPGPELTHRFRTQAQRFGADLRNGDVHAVSLHGPAKSVTIGSAAHHARAIILAMGAAPRRLGVPGEDALHGHGLSISAKLDGPNFCDQHVAVIGGGEAAIEEAIFLTRFARSVTVIHQHKHFRATRTILEHARAHNVTTMTDQQVLCVLGTDHVTGISLRHNTTSEHRTLEVTGVFVAVGQEPRSTLVAGLIDLDTRGHIRVDARSTHTSADGVFAAGDLIDARYRQAITAAASGCIAAIDAQRWLTKTDATTSRQPRTTVQKNP
ncbi:NAD(P)/FAD-dependent oxidoreductase [Mycobacterium sp. HNNTM2301]|uniref:NAD(P)/FAD-dependent oxidoreductase n=1 Tax=Mycobacterium hainanense TaxID=3289775 RepID=UPI0035A6F384